jgi:glycosyltransferase involved in cell wall biosynthesis
MLHLAGYEVIRSINHQILPLSLGPITGWINRYIGNLPVINLFTLMFGIIARPVRNGVPLSENPTVSVVIPCRNEAGHIAHLAERLPDLGQGSEVIWVEGHSTDNTAEKIREVIKNNPGKNWIFLEQPGRGKGDAVRHAFAHARGDILMILDADITVPPEDLPKFVNLLTSGKAEFVNGCRLVYPMDEKSMRFLNLLANKFFAALFTFLLGQRVRDTLCGTKALWHIDYKRISKNRSYFGEFDPFGDFDLLFGATRLNLKIVDLPIRYGERTYGKTNISRFRDGMLLLRMCLFAARKLKFI